MSTSFISERVTNFDEIVNNIKEKVLDYKLTAGHADRSKAIVIMHNHSCFPTK